ncbi:MAG: alpha/beta hydrolase-fold protein [Acidobacteriota bacterium]|nr:alpha/beta hydrolase-fold protein [Acidobacteriota bacterium]
MATSKIFRNGFEQKAMWQAKERVLNCPAASDLDFYQNTCANEAGLSVDLQRGFVGQAQIKPHNAQIDRLKKGSVKLRMKFHVLKWRHSTLLGSQCEVRVFGGVGFTKFNGVNDCLKRLTTRLSELAMTTVSTLFVAAIIGVCSGTVQAQHMSGKELIALAQSNSTNLSSAVKKTFSNANLQRGTATMGYLSDVLFVVSSASRPEIIIDDAPGPELKLLARTGLWYTVASIPGQGHIHSYFYTIDGKRFGGSTDLPVWGAESYLRPGVLSGTLSKPLTYSSEIYDGMTTTYWIYAPADYDPKKPAALMVMLDGQWFLDRDSDNPFLNTIDNLIAEKKIPVMICVFISPGRLSGTRASPTYSAVKAYSDKWKRPFEESTRSMLYDTVSDRYPRYLRDEVLAEVEKSYNIRTDAYSRGIMGGSSGGIASFNAAWQMNDQFSRVISWIGSFVSLQWKEESGQTGGAVGGQDYPDMVLRGPKRNIRVWLEDGSRDMQFGFFARNYGSWPAANLRMANALKLAGYDFFYSLTEGTHNLSGGSVEVPTELEWLWGGYDPAKRSETFVQDPAETKLPPFRFKLVDRATDH